MNKTQNRPFEIKLTETDSITIEIPMFWDGFHWIIAPEAFLEIEQATLNGLKKLLSASNQRAQRLGEMLGRFYEAYSTNNMANYDTEKMLEMLDGIENKISPAAVSLSDYKQVVEALEALYRNEPNPMPWVDKILTHAKQLIKEKE